MKRFINFTLILLIFNSISFSQATIIKLNNPSFEDLPRHSNTPIGWLDCGFPGETPPDVLPTTPPVFNVSRPAFDGNTYLGLVTRDIDTWERVGQELSSPLLNGQCYQFSIYLCRSSFYASRSRKTTLPADYVRPVQFIIWGGNENCSREEKLASTDIISKYEWQQFDFLFNPSKDYTHIMLEVFYETPVLFAYNGNLLLDNASAIIPLINCDSTLSVDSLYNY